MRWRFLVFRFRLAEWLYDLSQRVTITMAFKDKDTENRVSKAINGGSA